MTLVKPFGVLARHVPRHALDGPEALTDPLMEHAVAGGASKLPEKLEQIEPAMLRDEIPEAHLTPLCRRKSSIRVTDCERLESCWVWARSAPARAAI